MKTLVVEDDFTSRLILHTFLSRYGECHIAVNGREAVEAFGAALESGLGYSLVCMDIMMPEMDGYETMSTIRQIPEFRTLPIVALTAKAMKGDRAKCLEAGASDYITKPVDIEQLFSVLRVCMGSDQYKASQMVAPGA